MERVTFLTLRGLNRHFATLCATCSFNASFKQLVMAGEPGFGVPVLPGTPEAFTVSLIVVSLCIAPLPVSSRIDALLRHARASRPLTSGYFE
ncbi:MAG: hypothetical protein ABIR56_11025 [Polaromonas sp.]